MSNPIGSRPIVQVEVAQNYIWDVPSLSWIAELQPSTSGGSGGGGGAVTIADGADTAQGATTDAAITTNTTGTISGKLRGLVAILADVWDSVNGRLNVSILNVPTVTVGNSSIPVTGTFWQTTQPVSIATMPSTPVTGTFWQATQPVSGTVTANIGTGNLAGITGTVTTSVSNFPATQPVSGTVAVSNFPATQPVSGTFWQTTQPVSGTVAISGTVPVSGTFWQSTQPVSAASLPLPANAAQETGGNLASIETNTAPLVASTAGGYVRQDSTATIAKESGGNLATVNTNTAPFVVAGAGGYIRQDSTATIAKESGGNLATVNTNTAPLVVASAGGYVRQDSTGTIAKETGGNLATIATNTTGVATAANQVTGNASLATIAELTTPNGAYVSSSSQGVQILAEVCESPPTYLDDQLQPLSLTSEGLLRTATVPISNPIWFTDNPWSDTVSFVGEH